MTRHSYTSAAWRAVFLALGLLLSLAAGAADRDTWLLIDTSELTLSVVKGDKVIESFRNIAIGRSGTTTDKVTQDEKTPLGEYRVARISDKSHFHLFIGLDYPTVEQADRALKKGIISVKEYVEILRARKEGRVPPQNTPLGGYIGIHGIGAGDPEVHGSFNWTNGCIAVTNEQIEELGRQVSMGMKVVIR